MAAEVPIQQRLWNVTVLEMTKAEQERGTEPLAWATRLSSILDAAGISTPSIEVSELLVSHICWSNNTPIAWKFLGKALALRIVPPMFVLALLSTRVISGRRRYPVAYRLYMELLKRYAFSLPYLINGPHYKKIMESINDILQLCQIFGVQSSEPGHIVVDFIFAIVWELLDASLDDEGLLEHALEKKSRWPIKCQDIDIGCLDEHEGRKLELQAALSKMNTLMAIEIIGDFFHNKGTSRILYLARQNMPMHWDHFIQHLRFLIANSASLRTSKHISPEGLLQLSSDTRQVLFRSFEMSILGTTHMPSAGKGYGTVHSAPWLPIDLYLEDAMDGSQVRTTSAAETLTGLVKSLQALNQTTWHDAFLGLWTSALRLVQRNSNPFDGPDPPLNSCLCMLLSMAILAVINIIGEEEIMLSAEAEQSATDLRKSAEFVGKRRADLVSSLQRLDDFEELLTPPPLVSSLANQAAAKAMLFLSGVPLSSGHPNGLSLNDVPLNCFIVYMPVNCLFHGSRRMILPYLHGCPPQMVETGESTSLKNAYGSYISRCLVDGHLDGCIWFGCKGEEKDKFATVKEKSGNLRHLIVEACIARNILDTSAYLWPGYVKGLCNQIPRDISGQMPGWASFMKGSPLTPPMVSALATTPATSFAEIERMYEIAVSGTDDEKIFAATIFCGASLFLGWNIQEHTGFLITKLLSPGVPTDFSGTGSHLIGYAPFLNALLVGLPSIGCIKVSQLLAAVMPICEVFGCCAPNMSWTLNPGEEISSHTVFSNAFVLLLKLWRFEQPPLNHVMGDGAPGRSHVTPDYLLFMHNSQQASYEKLRKNKNKYTRLSRLSSPSSRGPVFMDSFPKLKCWFRKHQECIASIFSSLVPGNPVHQIVEKLLSIMFKKISRGGQPLTPTTSRSSSSSTNGDDESYLNLKIPAWDILEAVPFVLDASFTACAHERLSPRELITGLKKLADFLPASLATILGYCSAEMTKVLWKPALLNGIDWPSPAANLSMVVEKIKEILAATGVSDPCLDIGASSTVTIPLPLAVLVSLTITYKVDKVGECYVTLIGPKMRNLAVGCPWPCMPALTALWSQKAKHWSDFLIFKAAQTIFHHSNDAVVQLLRTCFTTTLGNNASVAINGGVGALMGHGFGSHFPGGISAVAPGILYLRVHRVIRNAILMTEEILSLLVHTVKDIAYSSLPLEKMVKRKKTEQGMKYSQVSLVAAMNQVKTAASLGASFVWITGGLNSVQYLFKEILPSWLLRTHESDTHNGKDSSSLFDMLCGYALAYFTMFCGLFAWGVDSSSPASKRRPKVLEKHFEFLASAISGKIWLGCNKATWKAYVIGYLSLIISCTPTWMLEVDVGIMKGVSEGLKRWNEEEMAIALLGVGGINTMGVAAEMIIETIN